MRSDCWRQGGRGYKRAHYARLPRLFGSWLTCVQGMSNRSHCLCPARSAGDFVDLVQRGFYTGMEIQRADGFVVQTGKPDGDVSPPCCLISPVHGGVVWAGS